MNDLGDFLLARIDDDQDQARYATARPWQNVRVNEHSDGWNVEARGTDGTHYDVAVDHARPPEGACSVSDAAHIARWDPARVLAECDAKRRIVDAYFAAILAEGPTVGVDPDPAVDEFATGTVRALRGVLQLLALPYADHRDYREEWRP
jgi:hypothetical protein